MLAAGVFKGLVAVDHGINALPCDTNLVLATFGVVVEGDVSAAGVDVAAVGGAGIGVVAIEAAPGLT